MKAAIALMGLILCGLCHAGTVQLPVPEGMPGNQHLCATSGFNGDGTVAGACHGVVSSACSGRGCQPVTNTYTYVAAWDLDGNMVRSAACSVIRHHSPQPNATTYLNGYTAATCPGLVFNPTGTQVVVEDYPYYYVSTNAVGDEALNTNYAGFLYLP